MAILKSVFCQNVLEIALVEIPAENSLPDLAEGKLSYLPGLKADDSSKPASTDPGVIVYVRKINPETTSETLLYFFRMAPVSDYPYKTPLAFTEPDSFASKRNKVKFSPYNKYIVIDGSSSTYQGQMIFFRPQYDSATDAFIVKPGTISNWALDNAYEDTATLAMIDNYYYFVNHSPTARRFARFDMSSIFWGNISWPYTDWKFVSYVPPMSPVRLPIVDEAFLMGNRLVSIDKDGYVFFVNYASSTRSIIRVQQPFSPAFIQVDKSKSCALESCEVFVTEVRADNTIWLSKLRLVASTTPPTATVYATLDITSIGAANRPVQLGTSPVVVIAGSSRFYFYKQLDTRFSRILDSVVSSPTYTNMEPGSLVAGELNQSTYPDSFLMMAMFIKNTQTGAREVRMFVVKGKCDQGGQDLCSVCEGNLYMSEAGTCITCQVADCLECPSVSTCSRCKAGFALIQNACIDCPTTVAANAIYLSNTGPICVDRTAAPYNQGFGVVTTQTQFRQIDTCQDPNCRTCTENRLACTVCKQDHIPVSSACILCPVTTNNAILIENSAGKCVDRSVAPYLEGYGVLATQTAYRQIEVCKVTGCKTCYDDSAVCTGCRPDYVFYLGKCTYCPSNNNKNAVVLLNSQFVCVDRTVPPYNQGYGLDPTQTNFQLIDTCTVNGCLLCSENRFGCSGCTSNYIWFMNRCTLCPANGKNAIFLESNTPKCVDRTGPGYNTGYGLDPNNPEFPLLDTCQIENCLKCSSNRVLCETCPIGYFNHNQITCKICPSPLVLILKSDALAPTCVDLNTISGYFGLDPLQMDSGLHKPCSDTYCRDCLQNYQTCSRCIDGREQSAFGCQLPTNPNSPSPNPPAPTDTDFEGAHLVTQFITHNSVHVLFAAAPHTPTVRIEVSDSDGQNYTEQQVGASYEWQNQQLLVVEFASEVTVVKGILRLHLSAEKTAAPNLRSRLLAPDVRVITISNLILMKKTLFALRRILQWLFWVLRYVGSFILFGKHPHLAMSLDYFISMCLVLSVLHKQVAPFADIPLQLVGQTKLTSLFMHHPALVIAPSATRCDPGNAYSIRGFVCTFVDNMAPFFIELSIIACIPIVATCIGNLIQRRYKEPQSGQVKNSKGKAAAVCILRHCGWNWILAKLHFNHIEIFLSAVISYSLADSSSKSVGGVIAATVILMGYLIGILYCFIIRFKSVKRRPPTVKAIKSQLQSLNPLHQQIIWVKVGDPRSDNKGLSIGSQQQFQNTELTSSTPASPQPEDPTDSSAVQSRSASELRWWHFGAVLSLLSKYRLPSNPLQCLVFLLQYARSLALCCLVVLPVFQSTSAGCWATALSLVVQIGYSIFHYRCVSVEDCLDQWALNVTEAFAIGVIGTKFLMAISYPAEYSQNRLAYFILAQLVIATVAILGLQIRGFCVLCKPEPTEPSAIQMVEFPTPCLSSKPTVSEEKPSDVEDPADNKFRIDILPDDQNPEAAVPAEEGTGTPPLNANKTPSHMRVMFTEED